MLVASHSLSHWNVTEILRNFYPCKKTRSTQARKILKFIVILHNKAYVPHDILCMIYSSSDRLPITIARKTILILT